MSESLAKQLPDGSWVAIADRLDDGTIAPMPVGDCCCDDDPPVDEFDCDDPPTCYRVDISGIVGQLASFFVEWPHSDYEVVSGLNGIHYITATSLTDPLVIDVPIVIIGTEIGGTNPGRRFLAAEVATIGMRVTCPGGQLNPIVLTVFEITLKHLAPLGGFAYQHFFTSSGSFNMQFGQPFPNTTNPVNGLITGDGSVTITMTDNCPGNNTKYYAEKCGEVGTLITVDLDTRTDDLFSILYQDDIYSLTPISSEESAVPVTWTTIVCDEQVEPESRIGVRCDGSPGEVYFDPSTIPAGAITFVFGAEQYKPTTQPSNEPPVAVVWSTDPCPSLDRYLAYPCDGAAPPLAYELSPNMAPGEGIVWNITTFFTGNPPPNDVCTRGAKYQCTDQIADGVSLVSGAQIPGDCSGTNGFELGCSGFEGPIDVPNGPRVTIQEGVGLGDLVAQGINLATLGLIKPCSGCKKRQNTLNKIRLGRR